MYRGFFKRFLDVLFSLISIIVLSPLMLITFVLVFIFLGRPVIFKQERPGKNEKIFRLYKFRTMTNAKDKGGKLLPDEKRLTKFGNFLRSTSIDELPELFNILKGDMSFVGPRPLLVRDLVFFDKDTMRRQEILPGLTGLAQANGRNSIIWDDRFKYDLLYLDNFNFLMDCKIIILTIKAVLKKDGIGEDGGDLSMDYGDFLLKAGRISKKEYLDGQDKAQLILSGIQCRKTKGLVSIITPSYNTSKYIGETIKSVLKQTYKKWELIIVDDCSTDDTEMVIKKFLKDKRIIYIRNKVSTGAAEARNTALRHAKGEFVAFLDSDDIWMNNKLEKQIDYMNNNDYYFTYTCYEQIDEESNPLHTVVSGPKRIGKTGMYNYCWPGCLTVMYNQEKIGLIQIENLAKNNDYAIWLKAIKKANCYLLDEVLSRYRIRSGSISRNSKTKLIKYHYRLFRNGEHMNAIISCAFTIRNLFFGVIKRMVFVKKHYNKS